jgi:hypothetical protein
MKESGLFHSLFSKISKDMSDAQLIQQIRHKTFTANLDNISRTNEYLNYFLLHPEIKWSFLASMVSRNAGWNMCDLEGKWYPHILDEKIRKRLYLTYERANWLIFHDAFPQLLLYHYSTILNRSLFHLLNEFHVSKFMQDEWNLFLKSNDQGRLMKALIINEQNLIEKPVIQHPVYKKRVFTSGFFIVQDILHFNCVLFPTLSGQLYGASVTHFRNISKRISLGNNLANILFHPDLYPNFIEFSLKIEHTGSRHDYERFLMIDEYSETPCLRTQFPVIEHHIDYYQKDWSLTTPINPKWFKDPNQIESIHLTKWFLIKQKEIRLLIRLFS